MNSDVNGKYCDMTGPKPVIRQIPLDPNGKPKYAHYNSDSFWCTFWDIGQVWGLAYPQLMESFCSFMVDMYKNGGLIPRGPSGGNYTFIMLSASSTPFIVSAYMKGIRNFDVQKAYEGMRKNAFPGGLMSKGCCEHNTWNGGGADYYVQLGYVPHDRKFYGWHSEAAKTLTYVYEDWCLAQMAKALGGEDDYQLFMKRAQNYKNLFDPSVGFMRPKNGREAQVTRT